MARLCTNHGFTEFRSDNRTGLSYLLSDAAFRALDALLVLLHEELELLNAHLVAVVPVQRKKTSRVTERLAACPRHAKSARNVSDGIRCEMKS